MSKKKTKKITDKSFQSQKNLIYLLLAGMLLVMLFTSRYTNGETMSDLLQQLPVDNILVQKINVNTDEVLQEAVLPAETAKEVADFVRPHRYVKTYSKAIRYKGDDGYRMEARDANGNALISIKLYGEVDMRGTIMNGSFRMKNQFDQGWGPFLDGLMARESE